MGGSTLPTQVPVLTANLVTLSLNGIVIGLVQSATINRNIGRRPVYQTGTPLFADAPMTQISVGLSLTNMVPQAGSLATLGLTPDGTLVSALNETPYDASIATLDGKTIATCHNSYFQSDSLGVTSNEPLTINVSLLCQDVTVWT